MSQAGSFYWDDFVVVVVVVDFNIKCSYLHSSEENLPWFKSVLSNLCFKDNYTPQSRLQQSVGSEARKHSQRRGSNLEIIFQRRKGKPRTWVPGSQTTSRKFWLPIPTAAASHCDSTQSSLLHFDLNPSNTDGEKNFLCSKRNEPQASQNLLRTWLLPICFILQLLRFQCISRQWGKASKQMSYVMLPELHMCPITSGKWA